MTSNAPDVLRDVWMMRIKHPKAFDYFILNLLDISDPESVEQLSHLLLQVYMSHSVELEAIKQTEAKTFTWDKLRDYDGMGMSASWSVTGPAVQQALSQDTLYKLSLNRAP